MKLLNDHSRATRQKPRLCDRWITLFFDLPGGVNSQYSHVARNSFSLGKLWLHRIHLLANRGVRKALFEDMYCWKRRRRTVCAAPERRQRFHLITVADHVETNIMNVRSHPTESHCLLPPLLLLPQGWRPIKTLASWLNITLLLGSSWSQR